MEDENVKETNSVVEEIASSAGYKVFNEKVDEKHLELYNFNKGIQTGAVKFVTAIDLLKKQSEFIMTHSQDDAIKQGLVEYLGKHNEGIEENAGKVEEVISNTKTIDDSEFNISAIFNNNANNLDDNAIDGVVNLYSACFDEINNAHSYSKALLEDFTKIFGAYIAELMGQLEIMAGAINNAGGVEAFAGKVEEYGKALEEGDEEAIAKCEAELTGYMTAIDDTLPEVEVEDIYQDVNIEEDLHGDFVVLKVDGVISESEFRTMINIKGEEYALEYVYTLPKEEREPFFKILENN